MKSLAVAYHEPVVKCEHLTQPAGGTMVLEGRVWLPKGFARPAEEHGFTLTWQRIGTRWAFSGVREGSSETDALALLWFDGHPVRFDSVRWTAPSELEPDEWVAGARVILDESTPSRPVGFIVDGLAHAHELDRVAQSIRRAFGPALTLGAWSRDEDGDWRACAEVDGVVQLL